MTKPYHPRRHAPRHRWTDAQNALLIERYPHEVTSVLAQEMALTVTQLHGRAAALGLSKTKEFRSALAKVNAVGLATRFKPGCKSWNDGKAGWQSGGRSGDTQFKKGAAPLNRRAVGDLRTNSEGYVDIKVAPGPRQWVPLHRHLWQQHTGEALGKDEAIAFRDGNKDNMDISNLEKVSRGELMRRNSYHNYGPEVAQIHQLRGAIARQINKRKAKTA